MASNRLFLVHRPTGKSIMLGKRLAYGWYNAPDVETLQAFFNAIPGNSGQDDFCLTMEDVSGTSGWVAQHAYDEHGKPVILDTGDTRHDSQTLTIRLPRMLRGWGVN